ncbi:MAG: aconitate hydratase [Elusimicrobia bacterium RIFCSPLOWO2_01_FULL_64_13]|nr:MAG: aconitate hydratase [Elusimicrobia bacterium RIFCSPLOWO2_01_FULL_64_13]
MLIETTRESAEQIYGKSGKNLAEVRKRLARPLTLAEKVLFGHLDDPRNQDFSPGQGTLVTRPDRVAMQDATAQMALLQFAQARLPRVAVPATVHCDHLIRAQTGAAGDLEAAEKENGEVYHFLKSASSRFGIGFWKPGAGIIHQVLLENYALPGGMMLGTDSHTPNAGGLGMIAVGVGGADAVDVMAGLPWEVRHPGIIGVRLTGELSGWASPKDVILVLCGILTTQGGTNRVIEYFGPGTRSISCTGKATITNMGAELGATTSIFPYDPRMAGYLKATGRAALAEAADLNSGLLTPDPEVEKTPEKFYERVVEIDLSKLEPHVVGPHTPDLARPISRLAKDVAEKGYPDAISAALIGSCTNSSYEDLTRSADVARQASSAGIKARAPLLVTPGSEQIYETVKRDGQAKALEDLGAVVLANACGPCIGQWKRQDVPSGRPNSILTSFNRNFPKRNDGNPATLAFIASPEIVVALALAGRLSFNPLTDELPAAGGKKTRLVPPAPAPDCPARGFVRTEGGYFPPPVDGGSIALEVDPKSDRLQILDPFPAWDGKDLLGLPILLKARGKCTTDHISPAGPWLKYRGHLDHISDNLFLGAVNAFTGEPGKGTNAVTGEKGSAFPKTARDYRAKGLRWIVVGDANYGEGSSREHAAMSPRLLGCAAVIARSFARIHETNLKKQGILPFTFSDPSDYDRVEESDRADLPDLASLAPGKEAACVLRHKDGSEDRIRIRHNLTSDQIGWFQAGSALNLLRKSLIKK